MKLIQDYQTSRTLRLVKGLIIILFQFLLMKIDINNVSCLITREFFYDNFNKKILLNFLVKIVTTKTHGSNLMHFQREMVHFFPKK